MASENEPMSDEATDNSHSHQTQIEKELIRPDMKGIVFVSVILIMNTEHLYFRRLKILHMRRISSETQAYFAHGNAILNTK